MIERGIRSGDQVSLTRTFTDRDVAQFGRLTGDMNPYHFCPDFARATRFGRPIAHGLLVASMLTEVGGQWAWLATEMSFKFTAPVFSGDTITLELEVVSQDERNLTRAEARWVNQDSVVVATGSLAGYPPTSEQRRLLGKLCESAKA